MIRLRSAVSPLALLLCASPLVAQTRTIDEGTFTVTKPGAPSSTESFRIIRRDDGQITATSHQVTGTQQTRTTLTTDSSGTPIRYEMRVTDRGAALFSVTAQARAGRLVSASSTQAGDESMREYPMTGGRSIILEPGLVHQLYFVTLVKRPGSFQVIEPRAAKGSMVMLTPKGFEPVDVAGKSTTGTHYSLELGPARCEFWIDAQGRLLRVEIPTQGVVATREEAPR
jgi:hypothetical protein